MTRRQLFATIAPVLLPAAGPPSRSCAVTNVTVIDGAPQPNRTVVVENGVITRVDAAPAAPVRGPVVDGRGKFLIPGLWDMHVHLSVSKASALPVLLANGVTAVRDMGGFLDEIDRWRAAIESGSLAGPRIFRAGPMLNGRQFNSMQIAVESAAEARGAVTALHKAGVDFIKVHAAISQDACLGVADACKQTGLRYAGHLPRAMRPELASDLGQSSFEHISNLFEGTLSAGVPGDADARIAHLKRFRENGARALFDRLARNGTFVDPTLVVEEASVSGTNATAGPHAAYISRPARAITAEMMAKYKDVFTPAWFASQKRQLDATVPFVRMLHDAGVRLLTGTDAGSSVLAAGFSLQEELRLLEQAGVPSRAVLEAASRNCAAVIGRKDLGVIQPGALADMVLLDANPLDDIRNTQKIRAVISGGKVFDRRALDALLAEGARMAKE